MNSGFAHRRAKKLLEKIKTMPDMEFHTISINGNKIGNLAIAPLDTGHGYTLSIVYTDPITNQPNGLTYMSETMEANKPEAVQNVINQSMDNIIFNLKKNSKDEFVWGLD